jgi:hypothetical protein
MTSEPTKPETDLVEARRRFLATCGKFAVVTPPAISLLLASAERNYAVAASGSGGGGGARRQGNNGFGNGGGDGIPGNSAKTGKTDVNR